MTVRAVVADLGTATGFRVGRIDPPVPGPGQVVVEVHHVSLNRGDINDARSGRVPVGGVLGSDLAGVVLRSTSDGPAVGARVVALATGAFAQRAAVDVDALALVPDDVELAAAAALPVAGIAAVQALRAGMLETPIKGARVLVTGASGGVGRFAVQLAAYGGAHVVAVSANPSELVELGADETLTDVEQIEAPVDLVLDTVGGPQLVAAWGVLAPGGNIQCIGASSGMPTTFPPYSTVGPAKTLSSFLITPPVGPDLAALVRLVAAGSLRVPIAWRGPVTRIDDAVAALLGRRVPGKAVLDLVRSGRMGP